MTRPNYIKQDQVDIWNKQINDDAELLNLLPIESIGPELKEVLYSGLFLVEELNKLGYDNETIMDIQFAHGSQSFGKDPWLIAKIFLDAYKLSIKK